jgi:hypothetical protein
MKLCFLNSKNKETPVGTCETIEEAYSQINDFLKDKGFESYYTRIWRDRDGESPRLMLDVGSHTEFFLLYGTEEELYSAVPQLRPT